MRARSTILHKPACSRLTSPNEYTHACRKFLDIPCSKPRLSRMCAALVKSHRWSKSTALSRWATALEKSRADKFADDMLR